MENSHFNLLKDLYEQALQREENRKNTFEQKASNIVGFIGATVGIFVGTLTPKLLSEELLTKLPISVISLVFWSISLVAFICGIIFFMLLVWRWSKMMSPLVYMYNDPSSFHCKTDLDIIEKEYLADLKKSVDFNQVRINELGSRFRNMINFVKAIVVSFFVTVSFLILCYLYL